MIFVFLWFLFASSHQSNLTHRFHLSDSMKDLLLESDSRIKRQYVVLKQTLAPMNMVNQMMPMQGLQGIVNAAVDPVSYYYVPENNFAEVNVDDRMQLAQMLMETTQSFNPLVSLAAQSALPVATRSPPVEPIPSVLNEGPFNQDPRQSLVENTNVVENSPSVAIRSQQRATTFAPVLAAPRNSHVNTNPVVHPASTMENRIRAIARADQPQLVVQAQLAAATATTTQSPTGTAQTQSSTASAAAATVAPALGQPAAGIASASVNVTNGTETKAEESELGSLEGTVEALRNDVALMKSRKMNGVKEGLPCPLLGKWQSDTAGAVFDISRVQCTDFEIGLQVMTGNEAGFINSPDWKAQAQMPFPGCPLLILTAIHDSALNMATFTGECRICDNKELISGHWLMMQNETTCEDLAKGEDFFGDVWRKRY